MDANTLSKMEKTQKQDRAKAIGPSTGSEGSPPYAQLSDEEIDALIAHPHWEPLGDALDTLITQLPGTTQRVERTTLLTWLYAEQGVAGFDELAAKLTGFESLPKRKKHLRGALRALEKLRLVSIVTFAAEGAANAPEGEQEAPEPPGNSEDEEVSSGVGLGDEGEGIGRNSMISLTWTGMVWLRRAWEARERLCRHRSILEVHAALVEEEDEGKSNDAYWVENIIGAHPEGSAKRAQQIAQVPAMRSIFDLAAAFRPAAPVKRRPGARPAQKALGGGSSRR